MPWSWWPKWCAMAARSRACRPTTGSASGCRTRGSKQPCGARRRCARLTDPDGLDIHELARARSRQLAAEARALHAPEGQSRIRLDRPVHEHRAGLELGCERFAARGICGPDARAEAEPGMVG